MGFFLYGPSLKARGSWTQHACLIGFLRGKRWWVHSSIPKPCVVGKLPLDPLLTNLANYVCPLENVPIGLNWKRKSMQTRDQTPEMREGIWLLWHIYIPSSSFPLVLSGVSLKRDHVDNPIHCPVLKWVRTYKTRVTSLIRLNSVLKVQKGIQIKWPW